MTRGRLPAACAVLLAISAVAADWARIVPPLALTFPADHGAHPAFRTEWWYTTGLLADDGGHRFGFELTFFRQGIDPASPSPGSSRLRARQVLAAHLAVVDVSHRRTRFAERVARAAGGLAAAAEGDLDVFVDTWEMRRLPTGVLVLEAADRDRGIAVSLELEPEKPLVLEGDGAVSRKGPEPGNASAYVSFTRLAARGRLTLDGRARPVHGEAWFDHEWGTSELGPDVVGWDWMGLRLGDGRELMIYRLRLADGGTAGESAGTLVAGDGSVRHLAAGEFSATPLTFWESPRTGARYPVAFRLRVPSAGLDLEARALVADAELDARASTGTVYWEGPVAVTGTLAGEGYAELVGYAGPLAGRF